MRRSTASDAFVACEALAADRARARTQAGDFADGYRAAANDIALAIRAKRYRQEPAELRRDVRDGAMEARTLARFVADVAEALTELGEESAPSSESTTRLCTAASEDEVA